MMECHRPEYGDRLPELLADRVDSEEREAIVDHLAVCGPCREELALLEALVAADIPDPGDAFWASLPTRVAMEAEDRIGRKTGMLAALSGAFFASRAARAAMLGMAVAGLFLVFLWPRAIRYNGDEATSAGYVAEVSVMELGTETELILAADHDLEGLDSFLEEKLAADAASLYPREETALLGMDALAGDDNTLAVLEEIIDEILPEYYNRG